MRAENKLMKEWLINHGIKCTGVKYMSKGSLKGCWIVYHYTKDNLKGWNILDENKWTLELADQFNQLGFVDFDNKVLSKLSGNGGLFNVCVKHPQLTKEFLL